MKNLAGLMKQAQEMQSRMEEMKARLDATETEGQAGAGLVRVVLSGNGQMRRITIDPKLVEGGEAEMLEDLVLAAHNDAKGKAEAASQAEMQKATGGLNLPPGFKLPF